MLTCNISFQKIDLIDIKFKLLNKKMNNFYYSRIFFKLLNIK